MMRLPLAAGILVALLSGCADPDIASLDDRLRDIREGAASPGTLAVPELPAYQPVAYRQSDRRSPFLAAEALADERNAAADRRLNGELAPDPSREKEPLEAFGLQQLQMVGTLSMGEKRIALVATPEHDIVSVGPGNYMGENNGQVTRVTPRAISLSERIFSRKAGWQKRDAELELRSDKPSR